MRTPPAPAVDPFRRGSLGLAVLVAAMSTTAHAQLAIRDVTVIDGTGAPARPHQTVVVENNRIATIGDVSTVRIPRGARVLDGTGRFLLPGFVDMHVHTSIGPVSLDTTTSPPTMRSTDDIVGSREALRTLLAFGVTTIRDPGGRTETTVALRDSLRLGRLQGPRMFTAGSVIDLSFVPGMVATVKTEAEMRAEVARQAAAGVDYVKLYASLPPALVRAGVDEAHKHGIRAIAHLFGTSWTDAIHAGIDGIVHITPGSPLLLPVDRRPAYMKRFRGTQFMLEWFLHADLSSPELREMMTAMASRQVFHDPTLVTFDAMAWGDSTRMPQARDLSYASPSVVDGWRRFNLTSGWTAADFDSARVAWPRVLQFTRALFEAGVPLTAGTDSGNPFTVPGASFHRELELLVAAGIPALDVLRIATRNGARSLGMEGELGSIAPGKLADLVLLDADPIQDIRNTRRIAYVVQGGVPRTPDVLLPQRLRTRTIAR